MDVRTAWQAMAQSPRRFLASSWPWRSLAYLLCGVAPSAAVAAGVLAQVDSGSSRLTPVVLPLVALALLLSGPVVARYERWRLRLLEPGPAPDRRPRAAGAGQRALEAGYGVVCVVVLWLIDLAVVGLSLVLPVGLTVMALRSADAGWGVQAAMAAAAVALTPLAAYPLTAWAGARAALARAVLAGGEPELDRRLVEVTRSRARLVDAFELDRRRIERDLHDGAQQRLVALTVSLGLAKLDLQPGSDAAAQVGAAHEQAKQALAELRELLNGVHPQVLTDRGLPAAVDDAAGRSPVPVVTDVVLPRRLPPGVEVAAYFAACEALANLAKHSRASRASVWGRLVDGVLVLEVRDDGAGGADPAGGTGLTGLADRVAVVDGRLLLSSPPGGPTLVRVEIPCPPTIPSG
jgi:signal transduction histidine kinase